MTRKSSKLRVSAKSSQARHQLAIAQTAAHLITVEGENNYQRACLKAAHSLGLDGFSPLPTHADMVAAVQQYQALFQAASQPYILREQRAMALTFMRVIAHFSPRLLGAVADGTANRFSDLEIEIMVNELKDLDFFLIQKNRAFKIDTTKPNLLRYRLQLNNVVVVLNVLVGHARRKKSGIGLDMAHLETCLHDSISAQTAILPHPAQSS